MWVDESQDIVYQEGDVLQVIGHVEYEANGVTVTMEMAWDS